MVMKVVDIKTEKVLMNGLINVNGTKDNKSSQEYNTNYLASNRSIVNFKDKNLEIAIKEELNKYVGNITIDDMLKLKHLNITGLSITNLSGINYATNIEQLNISYNNIEDIQYLKDLINLKELDLTNNEITDISYLYDLNKLHTLYLWGNLIKKKDYIYILNYLNIIYWH